MNPVTNLAKQPSWKLGLNYLVRRNWKQKKGLFKNRTSKVTTSSPFPRRKGENLGHIWRGTLGRDRKTNSNLNREPQGYHCLKEWEGLTDKKTNLLKYKGRYLDLE